MNKTRNYQLHNIVMVFYFHSQRPRCIQIAFWQAHKHSKSNAKMSLTKTCLDHVSPQNQKKKLSIL